MPTNTDFDTMFMGLISHGIKHGWKDRNGLVEKLNQQSPETVEINLQSMSDELDNEKFIKGADFFQAVEAFTLAYLDDD